MRILHILKDLRNVGNGVTNAAVDMAIVQQDLGHTIAVASDPGEYLQLLAESGISYYPLHQGKPLSMLRSWFRLRAIIREFRPQIVHCHLSPGTILAFSTRMFARYSLVSHVHNGQQRRSIFTTLADGVIAVSDAAAESMSKFGVARRKLFVVRNCVVGSARHAALSGQPPRNLAQPAIVTVAGLNKRKNIDGLIAAFESVATDFPDAHLYLVGEGPDRSTFEAQAANSSAKDRIHFEGFQKDPKPYMASASIFVLASWRESFGLVLHEAREAGAAVVASDVDGIPEALDYGRAGILIPVGDKVSLASALRRLLSDPAELDKWRKASRQGIDQHTVRHMGENLVKVYQTLLRRDQDPRTTAAMLGAKSESSP